MRILNSCVVWQDSILQTRVCVRQPSRTFYAPLLVFDKTLVQLHFAVGNCSDAVMSVLLRCFNAQPDNFSYELLCRSI